MLLIKNITLCYIMKAIISFMKKQSQLHLILMTLIVLFIVSDITIPTGLAALIDNPMGNIAVVVIALSMLLKNVFFITTPHLPPTLSFLIKCM